VRPSIALTILGMAVVRYLPRAPLLLALAEPRLSPRVRLWLRLVPIAVLPALAVPMVLAPGGRPAVSLANPLLWGALIVFVLAAGRVNVLACVAAGVTLVAILRGVSG